MSRPFRPIDWKKVEFLLCAGCSGREIASEMGMDKDTLYDAAKREKNMCFSEYSAMFHSKGEAMLKSAQFAKAVGLSKNGDTQLLTWLGKVRLKQKEPEPEPPASTVPNEIYLNLEDENLKLRYEIQQLKNEIQSKTGTIL